MFYMNSGEKGSGFKSYDTVDEKFIAWTYSCCNFWVLSRFMSGC